MSAPDAAPAPGGANGTNGAGAGADTPVGGLLHLTALVGASAVVLGAFGAHALRARLPPDLLEVYRTGVLYHLLHALALLGVTALAGKLRWPRLTAALFACGVAVFSGSLYLLAVLGQRWLGAVTPVGGVALIAGWLSLLGGALPGGTGRRPSDPPRPGP